jgi:hypothetical protein
MIHSMEDAHVRSKWNRFTGVSALFMDRQTLAQWRWGAQASC